MARLTIHVLSPLLSLQPFSLSFRSTSRFNSLFLLVSVFILHTLDFLALYYFVNLASPNTFSRLLFLLLPSTTLSLSLSSLVLYSPRALLPIRPLLF